MALEIQNDAAEAWRIIRGNGTNLKTNGIPSAIVALQSSVTMEYVVFTIYQRLASHYSQLEEMKVVPGLNAYVQLVRDDPTYDAVAAVTSVTDAIAAAQAWIDTNTTGFTLTGDSAANAIVTQSLLTNRFTAAQTEPLRTLLSAITAAINNA